MVHADQWFRKDNTTEVDNTNIGMCLLAAEIHSAKCIIRLFVVLI